MDNKIEFDSSLYKFGMDWLNGVLPVTDVADVFAMLEKFSSKLRFDRWELTNSGKYNYSRRYCLDGKAFIQLMYNPVSEEEAFTACLPEPKDDEKIDDVYLQTHNNPYVFFSISGDGIRYLHSIGGEQTALNKLLFYFYRNSFKASRFDVYCDILDKDNEIVDLIVKNVCTWDTLKLGETALTTNMRRINSNFRIFPNVSVSGEHYNNVQIGNHSSNMGMFRCYNKLDEIYQGRLGVKVTKTDNENDNKKSLKLDLLEKMLEEYQVEDYFYRLEYELHKDYSAQIFNALMKNAEFENKLCFEDIFYSVLSKFFGVVDFTTMSKLTASSYCVIWQDFLDFVKYNSIHLVEFAPLPYVPMSKARLHSYLKKNSSFVFSMLTALLLNRSLMEEVVKSGGDKYFQKKKYNELRDELDVPGFMPLFVKSQLNRSIQAIYKWQNPA